MLRKPFSPWPVKLQHRLHRSSSLASSAKRLDRNALQQQSPRPTVNDPTRPRPKIISAAPRSLHPWSLRQSDFLDLSDGQLHILPVAATNSPREQDSAVLPERDDGEGASSCFLTYNRRVELLPHQRRVSLVPFPVGTCGFLYFSHHPTTPIGSAIRFRLAESYRDFSLENAHLCTEDGLPWQIPVLAIAASPLLKVLEDMLVRERLLPRDLFRHCSTLAKSIHPLKLGPHSQLLFNMFQPFYLDLSDARSVLLLANPERIIPVRLHTLFCYSRCQDFPFKSGRILCQFQRILCDDGKRRRRLKVLRIIEPPQFKPGCEGEIELPTGHFAAKKGVPINVLQRKYKLGDSTVPIDWAWRTGSEELDWLWNWKSLLATAPETIRPGARNATGDAAILGYVKNKRHRY